jgi:hypothetical protein
MGRSAGAFTIWTIASAVSMHAAMRNPANNAATRFFFAKQSTLAEA